MFMKLRSVGDICCLRSYTYFTCNNTEQICTKFRINCLYQMLSRSTFGSVSKLWIFRLHKTRIWFIHGTTRSTNQYVPAARYRQPSCTTNKFTNSNNCNSSSRITLMNSTKTWGKNRFHTRPNKSSEILNQPARSPMCTMPWDLRSKPHIYTNRN